LDLIYPSQQNVEQTEEILVDFSRRIERQLFESATDRNSIHFPLPDSGTFNEQVMLFSPSLFDTESVSFFPLESVENICQKVFIST
jgi:hypothetical protein